MCAALPEPSKKAIANFVGYKLTNRIERSEMRTLAFGKKKDGGNHPPSSLRASPLRVSPLTWLVPAIPDLLLLWRTI